MRWGGLGSVSVSDPDSSICLRHKRDKIPSAVNSLNVASIPLIKKQEV